MDDRHCTAYELIESLYGIGDRGGHIEECAECAARLAGMRERRRQSMEEPFADVELAHRFEAPRLRWSWRVAAVAATVVLAISVMLPRTPQRLTAAVEDQQLFEDAFRKVADVQAAPFAPLENLFERSEP